MSQSNASNQTPKKSLAPTPKQGFNSYPNKQPLTGEQIKEVVMEMLIEFNLIPQAQKKKVIKNV